MAEHIDVAGDCRGLEQASGDQHTSLGIELDTQGRVLIPARLRETAAIAGDVDVLGQYNYLDTWNHDRLQAKLQRDPYTDEDAKALSEFGI